jgi:hypothetical protein
VPRAQRLLQCLQHLDAAAVCDASRAGAVGSIRTGGCLNPHAQKQTKRNECDYNVCVNRDIALSITVMKAAMMELLMIGIGIKM